MLKKLTFAITIAVVSLSMNTTSYAKSVEFEPEGSCSEVLAGDTYFAALWAFGYVANKIGKARPVDQAMVDDFLADYIDACDKTPDESFVSVLDALLVGLLPSAAVSDKGPATGVEIQPASAEQQMQISSAEEIMEKMRAPDADLASILVSLKPTPEDIRTIFPEEMSVKLIEMYEDLFGSRLANESFPPPPYEVSGKFTTTFGLANDPLLGEISGGFGEVLDKFLIDTGFGSIIVTFPEVDDNMKLHGMVYVNDRWVLMMRPWRGLSAN